MIYILFVLFRLCLTVCFGVWHWCSGVLLGVKLVWRVLYDVYYLFEGCSGLMNYRAWHVG